MTLLEEVRTRYRERIKRLAQEIRVLERRIERIDIVEGSDVNDHTYT